MPPSPLAWLALRSIAFYQRHLSPRKGYCCALHAAGRGRSCSAYGYRAIARSGVVTGLALLKRRMHACARASASRTPRPRYPGMKYQQGSCDASCDIGDIGDVVDVADCCGDAWDWRRERCGKFGKTPGLDNEAALRERTRQARLRQQSRD